MPKKLKTYVVEVQSKSVTSYKVRARSAQDALDLWPPNRRPIPPNFERIWTGTEAGWSDTRITNVTLKK
jgi:hypothetical protein